MISNKIFALLTALFKRFKDEFNIMTEFAFYDKMHKMHHLVVKFRVVVTLIFTVYFGSTIFFCKECYLSSLYIHLTHAHGRQKRKTHEFNYCKLNNYL